MAVDWQRGITKGYSDPCRSQTKPATVVGTTVDSLVAAFVAQKRASTVSPIDITIDRFQGKQIDLGVPLDVNVDTCEGGQYSSWGDASGPTRWNQAPGQHDLLDILDVNGKTTVIRRSFYAANTAADLAELQAIVDSIKLTP